MKLDYIKCKICGSKKTLYIENKEFYCEEHCKYLNEEKDE